jgi:hypothetical protein
MTTKREHAEREAYAERAAIMEFDGRLPRAEAERLAGERHPGPWVPKVKSSEGMK